MNKKALTAITACILCLALSACAPQLSATAGDVISQSSEAELSSQEPAVSVPEKSETLTSSEPEEVCSPSSTSSAVSPSKQESSVVSKKQSSVAASKASAPSSSKTESTAGTDIFTLSEGFTSQPMPDEVRQRMLGKSYPSNCDVPFENLRYLRMKHIGFDGQTKIGEMVVNKKIATKVLEVFSELYKANYPIEKMVLVDDYNADDEASMTDNNTSSFCFRTVAGSNKRSLHSDGYAIDINPLYNPYVKKTSVEPAAGAPYADRTAGNPYFITRDSLPYKLFKARGFTWGGDWNNSKDYQHFSYS